MSKRKKTKRRRYALPKVADMDPVVRIPNNGFLFPWCCDCGLRHIWHFRVERGNSPEDDVVVLTGARDDYATKYRQIAERAAKNE